MTEIEKALIDGALESLSGSSLLASSVAQRMLNDKELCQLVVDSIDKELLAEKLAYVIVRTDTSRGFRNTNYSQIMKEAKEKAIEKVSEQMAIDILKGDA